jgi:cytochrome c biogenesis protein CcdA
VALLFPAISDILTRPFVRVGAGVHERHAHTRASVPGSLLVGASAGLLWTPCAGPILGLVLASVVLHGVGPESAGILIAFAAGASTALALALLAGGRVLSLMKRSLGADEWIRRGLGAAVLVGVVAIALGWDTGILARVSLGGAGTATALEQALVDRVKPADGSPTMKASMTMMSATATEPPGG